MTLIEFLLALLGGTAVIGPVVYVACQRSDRFHRIPRRYRRFTVALICGSLGFAIWGIGEAAGFIAPPVVVSTGRIVPSALSYGALLGLATFAAASILHAAFRYEE